MKKILNWLMPIAFALALVACGGGGGDAGTSGFGGGGSAGGGSSGGTAASIDVVASASTVGTAATDTVTITATVKDASNVAIAAAPVRFSSNSGNLSSAATVTTAGGTATAVLSAGADKTNRTITVTVTSGTVTGKVDVPVVSATAATVDVVASSNRVGTGGLPVTITAVVKSANNVALANAPIQFSSDTGNLVASSTLTGANGSATATFSSGADRSKRTATIRVSSGSISGTLTIVVDGTTLSVSGPSTVVLGATAVISFKLADSTGTAIANQSIAISSLLGNVPAATTVTTDSLGTASYSYVATVAGADTLTIVGAGVTEKASLAVSGQNFTFSAPLPNATISVGTVAPVTVRFLLNGALPANGLYEVRFASTAGTVSSLATVPVVGGIAATQVTSSFAGPATVQATVYALTAPAVSVAQASIPVSFNATVPSRLILQASPSAIAPNGAGSTTQQAEVQAKVIDASFNPVAGVVVNFSRLSDTSGGNLSQAAATTDVSGIARVQYVSGGTSTGTDGVTLQGVVATAPAVTGTARLTVNQSALFIALGQGNEISNINQTTYQKQWTAYVTDSTGAPVPNVLLTVRAVPTRYGKGTYVFPDDGDRWATTIIPDGARTSLSGGFSIFCDSEDARFVGQPAYNNGLLDAGEDTNGNGTLQPGNVISVNAAGAISTVRTDASGFAIINLQYAESYATWVEIALRVSALVAGTESSNTALTVPGGAAPDYTNKAVAPAGVLSPFGVGATCSNPN